MAVGFGAIGTITGVSNTTVTPGLPGSLASGDVMLAFIVSRNDTTVWNTPSGWNAVTNGAKANTTGAGPRVNLFWRAWQSGDTAPSFTIASGGATNSTDLGVIVRVTGASTTAPVMTIADGDWDYSSAATADETWNPGNTVTRPTNGALVAVAAKQQDFGTDGASTTITATWTKITEFGETSGTDAGLWAEQSTSVSSVSSLTFNTSNTQTGYWTSVVFRIQEQSTATNANATATQGGTATANNATTSVKASAGVATATGAGQQPTVARAGTPTATTATAAGAGLGVVPKVAPTPTAATVTGTAHQPTIDVGGAVVDCDAFAGVALALGKRVG
jgi:hypothetical protein